MKIEEAKQIMGNSEMECSECPMGDQFHNCSTNRACADVALEAGRMVIDEAAQDAYNMATLAKRLIEQLLTLQQTEISKNFFEKLMVEADLVQERYEWTLG